MINTQKIKYRLVELNLTPKDIAVILRQSQPIVNQKLNNIRPMKLNEAKMLMELLQIESANFSEYFFTILIAKRNK